MHEPVQEAEIPHPFAWPAPPGSAAARRKNLRPRGNRVSAHAHASKPDRKAGRQQVKDCARSRFGLEVGKLARQTLIRRVQKGDVKYARKLTNSRTVIVLDHADGEMAFLYSSTTKEIICFLPPDAPEIAAWRRSQADLAEFRRGTDGAHN